MYYCTHAIVTLISGIHLKYIIMKKKSIKSLTLNKEVISRFNSMSIQGGKADTAQSFCGFKTCGPKCEAVTASVQTVCCD